MKIFLCGLMEKIYKIRKCKYDISYGFQTVEDMRYVYRNEALKNAEYFHHFVTLYDIFDDISDH